MNQKIKKINRLNNELDKQVNKENEQAMTDIICYLRVANISLYDQETIRQDLLEMVLSAQKRGEDIKTIIGDDYKAFCDDVITSFSPKSKKEKIIEFVDTLLLSTASFLGANLLMLFIIENIIRLIKREAIRYSFHISISFVIFYLLSIGGAFFLVNYISKSSFRTEKDKKHSKLNHTISNFLIGIAVILVFVSIAWVFKDTLFYINIILAGAVVLLIYVIHLILEHIDFAK